MNTRCLCAISGPHVVSEKDDSFLNVLLHIQLSNVVKARERPEDDDFVRDCHDSFNRATDTLNLPKIPLETFREIARAPHVEHVGACPSLDPRWARTPGEWVELACYFGEMEQVSNMEFLPGEGDFNRKRKYKCPLDKSDGEEMGDEQRNDSDCDGVSITSVDEEKLEEAEYWNQLLPGEREILEEDKQRKELLAMSFVPDNTTSGEESWVSSVSGNESVDSYLLVSPPSTPRSGSPSPGIPATEPSSESSPQPESTPEPVRMLVVPSPVPLPSATPEPTRELVIPSPELMPSPEPSPEPPKKLVIPSPEPASSPEPSRPRQKKKKAKTEPQPAVPKRKPGRPKAMPLPKFHISDAT